MVRSDPDLTFLTKNLFNFCNYFFDVVYFVDDYIHLTLENLEKNLRSLEKEQLCTRNFANYLVSLVFKG